MASTHSSFPARKRGARLKSNAVWTAVIVLPSLSLPASFSSFFRFCFHSSSLFLSLPLPRSRVEHRRYRRRREGSSFQIRTDLKASPGLSRKAFFYDTPRLRCLCAGTVDLREMRNVWQTISGPLRLPAISTSSSFAGFQLTVELRCSFFCFLVLFLCARIELSSEGFKNGKLLVLAFRMSDSNLRLL